MSRSTPAVLLSFDVEEFDAPADFGTPVAPARQLEVGVHSFARALDLLDDLQVTATLFVTATVARAEPSLVSRAARSHEVASHGWAHGSFAERDLRASREALEDLAGAPVRGFRRARLAPTRAGAVAEAGYSYDASENPVWLPGRYNNLAKPRALHRKPEGVWEVPASATPALRVPLFWLAAKTMPLPLLRACSRRCLSHDGYLATFFHPWELLDLADEGLPRYVRLRDGEAMAARVREWVSWLRERARFETMGAWLAERT